MKMTTFISYVSNTLVLLTIVKYAECSVTVIHEDNTKSIFDDKPAAFGPGIPDYGIEGKLVYLRPINNSCTDYTPVNPPARNGSKLIALMQREGCKFVKMVLAAQNMSYNAVIVFNNIKGGDSLVQMIASLGSEARDVMIPSVFVGHKAGIFLSSFDVRLTPRVYVDISNDEEADEHNSFLWTLLITTPITICFVLICCCFKAHCKECCDFMWGSSNRLGRRRQSRIKPTCPTGCVGSKNKSSKPQIRAEKFKEGHRYDTCAVCLDDFEVNDKLWILPCEHEFHVKCIKPWLTERQNSCPVCKRMSISLSILNV